jgi:pentatricopeptide repeat protein
MNAHVVKGDAAACERVMRDMQKAGQEPDVTTWSTLMNAHQKARSGFDVLRTFNEMRARRVMYDSYGLSSLFNGLMFGINGDRRAGALKVVELYPSLVTPANLNHFVATPILRALADAASAADVDRFWCFCEQHLQASRQGWPGNASAEVLFNCCSRAGNRGAWARVAALLSGASARAGAGGAAAAGGGARAESSRAGGGTDTGGNSVISRAFCRNWNDKGCCPFGERCRYKDGHR